MVHSLAIYDLVSDVLRARPVPASRRQAALRAPLDVWQRLLSLEGCTVQFERCLQRAGLMGEAPPALARFLRDATGASLRQSVSVHSQLTAIATLAERDGIRFLVLKGAGRLVADALGASRAIADIDLLASPADAMRLHALLRTELGYAAAGPAQQHHLAPVARAGSLPVEIHLRLTDAAMWLDAAMFDATRRIPVGSTMLEVPSATSMLLHTLEHATLLNWMSRYRLRDVLDVAACYTDDVDAAAVEAYVRASPRRAALETILSAAHELAPRIPCARPAAWRTVRRVSRARLGIAIPFGRTTAADRLFRYAGVLAEGSPTSLRRAAMTGTRWLRAAAAQRLAR